MVLIQRANKQLQVPEEWLEQYEKDGYKRVEIPKPSVVVNEKPKKRVAFVDNTEKNAEE